MKYVWAVVDDNMPLTYICLLLNSSFFRARSGYYLRRKWAALRRFVPNYEVKDLPGGAWTP